MFEKKETFWKKKGFYLSICTALICVLAVGTVYYKMNYNDTSDGENLFADSATGAPKEAGSVTGGSSIKNAQVGQDSGAAGDAPIVNSNTNKKTEKDTGSKNTDKKSGTVKDNKNSKKDKKASTKEDSTKLADASKDKKSSDKKDSGDDGAVAVMSDTNVGNKFDIEKGLLWPVSGDVILKYSMNNTVYFKTLAQYKCNPAIAIASEEGTKVKSAASGTVKKIETSDELGNMVTVDIGSGYTVTYGQMSNISVKEGQAVKEGDVLGKVAKPTKYYSEEGSNLYFQVMENDKAVDPMLLLR